MISSSPEPPRFLRHRQSPTAASSSTSSPFFNYADLPPSSYLDFPPRWFRLPNRTATASAAPPSYIVISARKGEFEIVYERGGQTCEHVQLAKTLGVTKLLIVVNKKDKPTVNWSKERYDEIEEKCYFF